ncbi:glycosyltransferase [Desulfovermiculus halophilus]|uniref:glycosyltransferase n=1 Tax=Desulfovermiculus halophilus TaxID=339722 RepID=UPI0013779D83|nr:glycosyltransferase [Desulfovermiculus halophilus]
MNIIHISTVHPNNDTRIFEKECSGLASKDHEVTLIIQSDCDEIRNNVKIKALPRYSGRLSRITFGILRAARKAFSEKGDIYHLHDPELLPLGLLLRVSGRRVVYDMHENLPEQIRTKHWIHPLIRKPLAFFISFFERLSLNRMAVVMAEKSYADHYNWVKRGQVVLNLPTVDKLMQLASSTQKNSLLVGYIGSISQSRGLLTVIEAIRKIREDGIAAKFECIGNVSRDVSTSKAYQQGVNEGWIHSPGRMPPSQGWAMIARCHIGIALLKPIGNYIDSYPTKMFEYMAMGLPVVVSDFPLYRDVVERHQCGFCVDPNDIDTIAYVIRFFIENPQKSIEMGTRGQNAVRSYYCWNIELEKLIIFYQALLA